MAEYIDRSLEEQALRQSGLLGRGGEMGNTLYAMDHSLLPSEAKRVIQLIVRGGPFPYPQKDGSKFGNRFGDLPTTGKYYEFTVRTPGVSNRGARRIVARHNGILFLTACHYERIQGRMAREERIRKTARIDSQWRNGFYVVTGLPTNYRNQIAAAVKRLHGA